MALDTTQAGPGAERRQFCSTASIPLVGYLDLHLRTAYTIGPTHCSSSRAAPPHGPVPPHLPFSWSAPPLIGIVPSGTTGDPPLLSRSHRRTGTVRRRWPLGARIPTPAWPRSPLLVHCARRGRPRRDPLLAVATASDPRSARGAYSRSAAPGRPAATARTARPTPVWCQTLPRRCAAVPCYAVACNTFCLRRVLESPDRGRSSTLHARRRVRRASSSQHVW